MNSNMFCLVLLCLWVVNSEQMQLKSASSKKLSYSSPDGLNKMFIQHSSESDMDSSASGYIYQSNGHGPATIVQLGEEVYQQPQLFSKIIPQVQFAGYGPASYAQVNKGSENNEGFYQSGGSNGQKGYKGYDGYSKGLSNKYGKQNDAGYYDKQNGGKSGHSVQSGHYGNHYNSAKGNKGGSSGESSSFKKGEKTTGYHKIFHKDEYKKEHSFYDESDKSGHHKSYGNNDQNYGLEKGSYGKGGSHDSGYNFQNSGKKGYFDNGSYNDEQSGYKGETGGQSYFGNDEEHGSKGSTNYEKEFGGGY